ncbi:unnamed protein product [Nesidiocoris tenuis]|uniref:Uncharacterized protein n=1 Tax=Nesidiocoris tenuis TaxID=355587 RepID=A0A6H5H4I6_9HEMI|nr:unnamed protein product [Nesidiocoris tenuis]
MSRNALSKFQKSPKIRIRQVIVIPKVFTYSARTLPREIRTRTDNPVCLVRLSWPWKPPLFKKAFRSFPRCNGWELRTAAISAIRILEADSQRRVVTMADRSLMAKMSVTFDSNVHTSNCERRCERIYHPHIIKDDLYTVRVTMRIACGAIPMLNAAVNCFQDIDSECESRGRKPKKDRDHCDAECAKTERFARSRACKEFLHRRLLYSVVIIELISNSSPPGLKKNDWLFPRNCCT